MILPDRETIYRISAEAYERTEDKYAFEHAVRSDVRVRGLSPIAIAIVVRLALILFSWWLASGNRKPTLVKDPLLPLVFDDAYAASQHETDIDDD